MNLCATCPAFTARPPLPEGANQVVAETFKRFAGHCRLHPEAVAKSPEDFCMQHPGLRMQMVPGHLRKPEVTS